MSGNTHVACECLLLLFNQDPHRRLCPHEKITELVEARKQLVAVTRKKQYKHLIPCKEQIAYLISQLNQYKKYWK